MSPETQALLRELTPPNGFAAPGLVDPHTHLLFAGERAEEYVRRAAGVHYQEIAASGGGILSTVRATRQATKDQLVELGLSRLKTMLSFGVTTVEVKTGYGLTLKDELKLLDAIFELRQLQPVEIVATFMPAHAVPPETSADAYIDHVCEEMLPAAKEHPAEPKFVDVFCEKGAFTLAQSRKVFQAAARLGFGLKIHADEFNNLGGSQLAGYWEAVSAEHLLKSDQDDWRMLVEGGVTPVLLPGTAFTLKEPYANARGMIETGLKPAIGTDFNPGSCPIISLPFVMGLAVLYMGLTPDEALAAVTANALQALALPPEHGADDATIWPYPSVAHIAYNMSVARPRFVIKNGQVVCENPV
ncbi:MAG: imidazolonepropionase [Armatimonadetes bacterium]|nr:imidazolonepropionase [Armatimonadota bacterium]